MLRCPSRHAQCGCGKASEPPIGCSNEEVQEYKPGLTISTKPSDKANAGQSSGGAAAMIMAWARPDLFSRVLAISMSTQYMRPSLEYPYGAYEMHSGMQLIKNTPKKELRVLHTVRLSYHAWRWLFACSAILILLHAMASLSCIWGILPPQHSCYASNGTNSRG